jgi:FtsH-binding integral membrane protein
MAFDLEQAVFPAPGDAAVDPALRVFLGRVYLKLAAGLAVSAGAAWCVAEVPTVRDAVFRQARGEIVGFSGWGLALLLAPLVVLFTASFDRRRETARGSGALYWTVAVLVGGSLGALVAAYAAASLVSTFLVTAAAFAAFSLWGSVTRRNLGGLGHFMVTALVGLILAMAANLFLRSGTLQLALDAVGVLIFAGLIAADTQRLRAIYDRLDDAEALETASNYGALTLYLNFVNLFELLFSLWGSRSRR